MLLWTKQVLQVVGAVVAGKRLVKWARETLATAKNSTHKVRVRLKVTAWKGRIHGLQVCVQFEPHSDVVLEIMQSGHPTLKSVF